MEMFATSLLASLGLTHVSGCGGKALERDRPVSDAGVKDVATSTGGRMHEKPGRGAGGDVLASGGSGGATGGTGVKPSNGGAGRGSGGSAGGGTREPPEAGADASTCANSMPEPGDPGYERCQNGALHRPTAVACQSRLPTPAACYPGPQEDASEKSECRLDSDCTARPNGFCAPYYGFTTTCQCDYGCRVDADCPQGQICYCGDVIGKCVAAECSTDSDCGGLLCLSYRAVCNSLAFACQTPRDDCVSDEDCPGMVCGLVDGAHKCTFKQTCVDGRPFLVGGAARVASLSTRTEWLSGILPETDGLEAADRAAIGARWTEIALMEHASIAAFARFALELLSLGAPPDLILRAQQAIAEETAHARDAFALASAYLGRPVGPGPLDVSGALANHSPLEVVRATILEGCIGETVAALEATEALRCATDPAVRDALSRVVVEETRHAELAYRFVQWALEHGAPDLAAGASEELVTIAERESREAAAMPLPASDARPALRDHGVLDSATRIALRARVLAEVVVPCARALSASAVRTTRRPEPVDPALKEALARCLANPPTAEAGGGTR